MKSIQQLNGNQQGFALVLVLMVMAVLSLIGVTAIDTSVFELQIAGNDARNQQAFYEADGGTDVGTEVIEQNIACITGFTVNQNNGALLNNTIYVPSTSLNLWQNIAPLASPPDVLQDLVNPDFYYPYGYGPDDIRTNLRVGYDTKLTSGSAIQLAAGYEGKAHGLSQGGAHMLYNVRSRHLGTFNSESEVCLNWRHAIGQEGDCYY
jgi:hypothetical protein